MNAAETRASSAMADCTPLTVVSRSWTTLEIDTFIRDVSTTRTNIAIASRMASRWFIGAAAVASPAGFSVTAPFRSPGDPAIIQVRAVRRHHPLRVVQPLVRQPRLEGHEHQTE